MNKQCTGCVVSAGTHNPAEALHQQIDEPQAEAMRLADECEESAAYWALEIDTRLKAANMLRAQHARIDELEKDAARWRAATRDLEINDIALCFFDKHGDEKIVMGDEADAAIDAAIAARDKHGDMA